MNRGLIVIALLSALSVAATAQSNNSSHGPTGQRVAPSSNLPCSRDHLTSFIGRVTFYSRNSSRITLRMSTDDATKERFTIRIARGSKAPRYFLINGEAFEEKHWAMIESARSKLLPKMRAIVWVCDDGTGTVIDWRPPER